ncbi:MAG: aldehyde dehydrogenase family protein [Acidobacteriota bacterium]|nr:aldehyde dehydrogenase family protein [Blastocatellia bacterium]MDW8240081.1 aldehyde dehydrogenase family protein [Acidobacteriota bacterium]
MVEQIPVRNPRTGQFDDFITPPTPEQLKAHAERLRQAQRDWWHAGLAERITALQQWREILLARKQELASVLAVDTGRWPESVLEVEVVISSIERWCRLAPSLLVEREPAHTSIPFIELKSQLVPYPLVGVISPWNFPLLLSTMDAIPALLAGCAVLVKPSEVTPRFIRPLNETVASVPLLRDVFGFVQGAGETGAALIQLIDLVCFTGSVETGHIVGEAAARRFIPAFLELGGKDPAVVLESADLELATSAILWGSVVNAGQSCLSIERIYVAETIFDRFVEKLVDKATRVQLAYPSYQDGRIGPIIDVHQADIIAAHLRDAVEKGATIHCGGSIEQLGGGLWCRPTVLTNVNHSMKVMTEETFGPLMPVMPFSTVQQAIDLANDTIYGLSAAVFGSEQDALTVAQKLEAGAISINDAALTSVMHEGEKHSFKRSGLGGSRMGPASIMRFLRKKALIIKTEPVVDPWWFEELKTQSIS